MRGPIGIFDSGYGGLTVLKSIRENLPQYSYLYLGDNARTPYGTRSFETVYQYTLEAVNYLFDQGCPLVILACNTASAKALRSIQQNDLHHIDPTKRVLGVIRPTSEIIGEKSKGGAIGILGTNGTVQSLSYLLEIAKFYPHVKVYQQACPMWVPLVENNELLGEGPAYFVQKSIDQLLNQSSDIDTILLGCTHYPLLIDLIEQYLPQNMAVVPQGPIVAKSLTDYLSRHPEMEQRCLRGGSAEFLTTDDPEKFSEASAIFLGSDQSARKITL
ncbi:MAG: glutamate racemase [Bacteroidota bacterium]